MKAIVIHVAGLHVGYVGCYGNDWISTPALDEIAAQGIVFDHHYADCLDQWPSQRTGFYQFSWKVEDSSLLRPPLMLEDYLNDRGVYSAGVAVDIDESTADTDSVFFGETMTPKMFAAAEELQRAEAGCLWIDFPSMLPPWKLAAKYADLYFPSDDPEAEELETGESFPPLLDPPVGEFSADEPDLLERLQFTYAGMVSQFDDALAALLQILRERELFDDSLLVLTTNRGVALGEHGLIGDASPRLHEEVAHLPLIVRMPKSEQAGRRIAALTQPVDLYATIIECTGLPLPDCHSRSLLPLMLGDEKHQREYACAGWKIGERSEWMLRTVDSALLIPAAPDTSRRQQLYLKPEDRWEVNDVWQQQIEWAEQLETVVDAWSEAVHQSAPFQPPSLPEQFSEDASDG